MALEPEFVAMLSETVYHAAYSGQDGYGQPTYAPAIARACRIEWKLRRIVTATGQERMSRARVFLDGTFTMDLRDQLTLPDGTMPTLQLVYAPSDVDGTRHHWEVSV